MCVEVLLYSSVVVTTPYTSINGWHIYYICVLYMWHIFGNICTLILGVEALWHFAV